jgi:hypothetical protein
MSPEDMAYDGDLTIDHLIPRSQGGTNKPSNLATACRSCNSSLRGKSGGDVVSDTPVAGEKSGEKVDIRNRIVEMRNIPESELLNHDRNPRKHPAAQKNAMAGVLEEIGAVQALVVYKSERAGGKYVLIDGHMRKNEFPLEGGWPCVVTDLTDDEADLMLQAFDPIGAMAMTDNMMLDDLRSRLQFSDASVEIALDAMGDLRRGKRERNRSQDAPEDDPEDDGRRGIPEMELQPYEHYDYVLILFKTVLDWNWFCEKVGIQRVDGSADPKHRMKRKFGLGRAMPGQKMVEIIQQRDAALAKVAELERKLAAKESGDE